MSDHYLELAKVPTQQEFSIWANKVLREAFVKFESGIDYRNYSFSLNNRLKTSGGRCRSKYMNHVIEVNPKILPEVFLYVLLHEISHGVTYDAYGRDKSGHTKEFYHVNNTAIATLGLSNIYKARRSYDFGISTTPRLKTYAAIACSEQTCSTKQNVPFVMSKRKADNRLGRRCSCSSGTFVSVNVPKEFKDTKPSGTKFVQVVNSNFEHMLGIK